MFNNYYKEINNKLKDYIGVNEKDFNKSPKNVRNLLLDYAQKKLYEKEKENQRINFNDIPNDIKKYMEIDKDTFEGLDILCQQFIIEYIYKYHELLNIYSMDENKKIMITKKDNKYFQNWLYDLNIILKNNKMLIYISYLTRNIKTNMENDYKIIKNLKANIKNNRKKINNNLMKKDKDYYEKKIIKYEENLNIISKIYINKKCLYNIFNNIIQLSKNIN